MIGKFVKGRAYVFIDAANLENSVKDLKWWVDYKKLFEYFRNETNLIGVRHYCPRFSDGDQEKFFTVLKRIGIKLVTKPLKIITEADRFKSDIRKANFDVEITLDALILVDSYDTLVLFSGDSDFDSLVKHLRSKGKRVLIVSSKYHVSRELIASSNKYIDLRKLRRHIERGDKNLKGPSFTTGS